MSSPAERDITTGDGTRCALACPRCLSFTLYAFPVYVLTPDGVTDTGGTILACSTCART